MHVVKTLSSRSPGPLPPGTPRIPARWVPAGVIAALAGTIVIADRGGATARPPDAQPAAAWTRPTLDIALADWLASICNADAGGACKPSLAANADGGIDVHFVSTEGGGIRAAVWTAFALQRFAERDAQFLARTFSISGVSGGAVGAAAFRACSSVGGGNGSRRPICCRRCCRHGCSRTRWRACCLPACATRRRAASCRAARGSSSRSKPPRRACARG
jgi:hypothetical protein